MQEAASGKGRGDTVEKMEPVIVPMMLSLVESICLRLNRASIKEVESMCTWPQMVDPCPG